MLFDKYQHSQGTIAKRGYSQNAIVHDESGVSYWVKWILGTNQNDSRSRMLTDKLRHLQKARHPALPIIKEYGYDPSEKAFAIVYQHLAKAVSLDEVVQLLSTQQITKGLGDVSQCLQELHAKEQISHGDIHPGNILVGDDGQFYLIDFGLADMAKTLSQERDLEVFAAHFAAPEKLDLSIPRGFPYQSDIFSLGKVIQWVWSEKGDVMPEDFSHRLQLLLAEMPSSRPAWQYVIELLGHLSEIKATETLLVSFRNNNSGLLLKHLNNETPVFDLSPNKGDNYLMNVLVGSYLCKGVLWLKDEKKFLFNGVEPASADTKTVEQIEKYGKKLPLKFRFTNSHSYYQPANDLNGFFRKWFDEKSQEKTLRGSRKRMSENLAFYRELLEKEKEVIEKNSLRLEYSGFEVKGDEVWFRIKENEKYSSIGFLKKHIEEGNSVDSEGFEYIVAANADRRQMKDPLIFSGKPYDFDSKDKVIKIKDCEYLKKDQIPNKGYLFENTAKKEEEKNRQLEAIKKTEMNDVQNPDLLYFLFSPEKLESSYFDYSKGLTKIWQKDDSGVPFQYSYNQQKAIQNALIRKPLSVIQGPPGTGKTTVITEIVFQLLEHKPDSKILITSQTNNAVDQVLENLLKNDIPILRLAGMASPKIESIKKHTLDRKLEGWKQQVKNNAEKRFRQIMKEKEAAFQALNPFAWNIAKAILDDKDWKKTKDRIEKITTMITDWDALHQLPDDKHQAIEKIDEAFASNDLSSLIHLQELHRDWLATVSSLDEKSAINQKLIDSIRVIGATCNHIAAKKYRKFSFEFDYVIMDESGKATTAEALVPIILGNNLVFVGDHRQLRPMLTATREVEQWLRSKHNKESEGLESWDDYFNRPSLFEEVISKVDADFRSQLDECRRSSEDHVQLTSKCFYEPEGDEPIHPVKRDISKEHNLPMAVKSSIIFIDIGSSERHERDNNGSSRNRKSAETVCEVLEILNKYDRVKDYSIGVITAYSAQFRLIKSELHRKQKSLANIQRWKRPEEKFTVSVVDRFQGLEKDIIILDLVKSGPNLDLGFLEVPNRLNVALSRQKKLLIIVGDYYGLINAPTRRLQGKKAALQRYLELMKPDWIVSSDNLKNIFQ